jgi:hypothetical protein
LAAAEREPFREPVACCALLRGIDTLTAASSVAELHDFRRFANPRQLMGYLGLVSQRTLQRKSRVARLHHKAGNTTSAGSWWGGLEVSPSPASPVPSWRRQGQPRILALADRAQERLYAATGA